MKHIIIPTDFTMRSLQPVHDVMNHYKEQEVRITLLHLVDVPDAIGDLLFRLRRMESRYPVPATFTQACEMMINKYEVHLTSLRPLVQYGTTAAYFENLLEGFRTDALFMDVNYQLTAVFEESVDMNALIKKSKCTVIDAVPVQKMKSVGVSAVSNLLLANS